MDAHDVVKRLGVKSLDLLQFVTRIRLACGCVMDAALRPTEIIASQTWCPLDNKWEPFVVVRRNILNERRHRKT